MKDTFFLSVKMCTILNHTRQVCKKKKHLECVYFMRGERIHTKRLSNISLVNQTEYDYRSFGYLKK